jgi:hypothetical protein
MSRENGFLPLRRALFDHVRDGRMSPADFLCFTYMLGQADTRTGVWSGSAGSIAGELGISRRTARSVIERLEIRRYLKRFPVPGRHACYPILLHKFQITTGEHFGQQLNALDSTSPADLRYFVCQQHGEHDVQQHGQQIAPQMRIENKETRNRKNPAAKTAPPTDPRFRDMHDSSYEAYRSKHGQPPVWGGKDQKALQQFLKVQPRVTLVEFQGRYRNFLDSTDRYFRQTG